MDKAKIEGMKAYLETMITSFEEHFGVQATIGRITYSHNNCKIPFEVAEVKEDGTVATKEAETFKRLANNYGLKPELLGQEFESQGHTFIVTGMNTRARKFPIQGVRKLDGARFKFPVAQVQRAFRLPITSLF